MGNKSVEKNLNKEPNKKLLKSNKIISKENPEIEELKAELVIADKETEKLKAELVTADKEKGKQAAELVTADKELALYKDEIEDLRAELVFANKQIVIQAKSISALMKDAIENHLLEKTLMSIGDALIATDIYDNVKFLNKAAETMTGWAHKNAIRKPISKVYKIINVKTGNKVNNIIAEVITSSLNRQQYDPYKLLKKDGTEVLIEDSAALILNQQNEPLGVVIVFRDYTEKWERLNKMKFLSFHDELTSLYNRRFYEEELKRMDTKRNLPLSLIMCDVNGLKLINDSFGHNAGDELLRISAHAISEVCRTDDMAARIGGDEFVIMLPKTNADDAALLIERIKSHYKGEKVNGLEISISFGTETKVDETQNINDIFILAEKRMYKHKIHESSIIKRRTINLITEMIYEKNREEPNHCKNVSTLVEALAKQMGFNIDNINQMVLLGLMHDIGKIGIADIILFKDEKLDKFEFEEIKKHPQIGYSILNSVSEFSGLSDFILSHHERWDGTGYPRGLKGEEIPIQSRMLALCDSYDVMINEQPYKKAISKDEAVEEIMRCSGTQFDPTLAKIFIEQVLKKNKF